MGNKRRTLAVIMGVFLFAFGIISGAFLAFSNWTENSQPTSNAVTVGTSLTEIVRGSSTAVGVYGYLEAKQGHTYYIELWGQNGYGAGNNHGYGAVVYGFYQASADKTLTASVGFGGGKGSAGTDKTARPGGGYAYFESFNIALPSGSSSGEAFAGGGGAQGNDAAGGNAGWAKGANGDGSSSKYAGVKIYGDGGGGATQTAAGSGGGGGNDAVAGGHSKPGNAGNGHTGGAQHHNVGAGGGGYYGGGSGGEGDYENEDSGGGGGGSSSPNSYGLYVNDASNSKSTGTGYAKAADLFPQIEPESNTGYVGTTISIKAGSTPSFASINSAIASRVKFEWKYYRRVPYSYTILGHTYTGYSWTALSNIPSKSNYGTETYRCDLVMTCIDSSSYPTLNMPSSTIIYSKQVTLTNNPQAGTVNAPFLTTTRNYIGEVYTNIIQSPGSTHQGGQFKYLITTTAKYYEGKAADKSLSWQTDVSKSSTILRGGTTYYIYYYATAPTDNSYTETTVKVSTLTVSKTTLSGNNIGVGTIEPQAGQVFNNETKSLFNGMLTCQIGSTSIKDQVEVYWAITSSKSSMPQDEDKILDSNKNLIPDELKGTNAGEYHLWVKVRAKTSTDLSDYPTSTTITWQYLDRICTILQAPGEQARDHIGGVELLDNGGRVYDGESRPIYQFTDPSSPNSVTFDWGDSGNLGDITMKIYMEKDNPAVSDSTTNNSVYDAGRYTLSVEWKGTSNVGSGTKVIGTYTITPSDKLMNLSGLTVNSAQTYNGETGYNLVKSGALVVADKPNGSTIMTSGSMASLTYAVVFDRNNPSVAKPADTEFKPYTDSVIKSIMENQVGYYSIWVKVTGARNIVDGTAVMYPDVFSISQLTYHDVTISGLSATAFKSYDGDPVSMFAGTATFGPRPTGAEISNIQYAWGDIFQIRSSWYAAAEISKIQCTDIGTYYLWVRWDGNENVASTPTSGRLVSLNLYYKITQKTYFADMVFEGIQKNDDKEFDNQDLAYGTGEINRVTIPGKGGEDDTVLNLSEFGEFSYALGNTAQANTTEYGNFGSISSVKVSKVGVYYLWIKWTGSENVAGGSRIYNDVPLRITATTDEHIKIYGFSQKPEQDRTYTGQALSLFTGTPSIIVNNFPYTPSGVIYHYALTLSDKVAPLENSSDWVLSLEQAVQTNVRWQDGKYTNNEDNIAEYYLWVSVSADDNMNAAVQCIGGASILRAKAEAIQPPSVPKLVYNNGEPIVLITPSVQTIPRVEYSLSKDTGYTFDTNEITGTITGKYLVYYRGAADENYKVQATPYSIEVEIKEAVGGIKIMPQNLAPAYNGKEQVLFKIGMGEVSYTKDGEIVTQEVALEYAWDPENNTWTEDPESEMMKKKEVGSYVLYFRSKAIGSNVAAGAYDSMTVTITKAQISPHIPVFTGKNVFDGSEKKFLLGEVWFSLLGDSTNSFTSNGANNSNKIDGNIGKIEYGISTSASVQPLKAYSDYEDVKATNAGSYYFWYRIWGGDNHLGTDNFYFSYTADATSTPNWKCMNENNPIEITQASSDNVVFEGFTWRNTTRYNGAYQCPIDPTSRLVIKISGNEIVNTARIWYALTDSPTLLPSDSKEWQSVLTKAVQVDAGNYYLQVKVEESANLPETIKCVNAIINSENDYIKILPARSDDLSLSGIMADNKMYDGTYQSLATGYLAVQIRTNGVFVEDYGVASYMYTTEKDIAPKIDSDDWKVGLENAKVINWVSGGYYLWVKLDGSSNVEQTVRLYSSTSMMLAKANEANLVLSNLVLSDDLIYNTQNRPFLAEAVRVELKNGEMLDGDRGKVYYAVTNNKNATPTDWVDSYGQAGKRDAGTYYIWVKSNGGDNYDDFPATLCGSVTIAKATGDNITLSGLEIYNQVAKYPYIGVERQLTEGELVQKIGSYTVTSGKVYFASALGYDDGNGQITYVSPGENDWKESISQVKQRDVGTYYIWVKVEESANIAAYTKLYSVSPIYIEQADKNTIDLGGVYANILTYTGLSQTLAYGNLTLEILGTRVNGGQVYWGVVEGDDTTREPATWYNDLSDIRGVNAINYQLWVKVTESANIKEIVYRYLQIKINKGQAEILTAPVFARNPDDTDLVYSKGGQALIAQPAISNFGSVVYLVSKDGEPFIDASLNDPSKWETDYRNIKAEDADDYRVYYAVLNSDNWIFVLKSEVVTIKKALPSFVTLPSAILGLVYNEEAQDLINFGVMHEDAYLAPDKCYLEFSYDGNTWYGYKYNATTGKFEWVDGKKLPGMTNAGDYTIYYRTMVEYSINYQGSDPILITGTTIAKRAVYWIQTPEPIANLRANGEPAGQNLMTAGTLSAGGQIKFSTDNGAHWSTAIPAASDVGTYYVWYKAEITDTANNYFVGEDTGVFPISIARMSLAIISFPESVSLSYINAEQELKYGGQLTYLNMPEEKQPYIEYGVDKPEGGIEWLGKGGIPTASNMGSYTVYYKVVYYPGTEDLFDFYGKSEGSFVSEIGKAVISDIVAVIKDGEISYEIRGDFPSTLLNDLQDVKFVYQYRVNDPHQSSENQVGEWMIWDQYNSSKFYGNLSIGHYEIRVTTEANSIFTAYEQYNDLESFDIESNITVQIYSEVGNTPNLRIWLDFTGDTTWDNAEPNYKRELMADNGQITFENVNSTGLNGNCVIRAMYVTGNGYYYLSSQAISKKSGILSNNNTTGMIIPISFDFKPGSQSADLYICEVYKITYNSNGGIGLAKQGWKWYGADYTIEANDFTMAGKETMGWSTSSGGSGTHYEDGVTYKENRSITLYAQFAETSQVSWVVWKIGDYGLAVGGKWVNVSKMTQEQQNEILQHKVVVGSKIRLPEIPNDGTGEFNAFDEYGYIAGWEANGVPYFVGITARAEGYTFVARCVQPQNSADYIEFKFFDENNNLLKVNRVASTAESYMALSGLTEEDYNTYAYEDWGIENKDLKLAYLGYDQYRFTERLPEPEIPTVSQPKPKNNWVDYFVMVIIMALGFGAATAGGLVYVTLRKKKLGKDFKSFKEDPEKTMI